MFNPRLPMGVDCGIIVSGHFNQTNKTKTTLSWGRVAQAVFAPNPKYCYVFERTVYVMIVISLQWKSVKSTLS